MINALSAILTMGDFSNQRTVTVMWKGGSYTLETRYGLCYYLHNQCIPSYSQDMEALLRKNFKKWKRFSGSTAYPVPYPNSSNRASTAFFTEKNLWVGKYGEYRLELVQFLIEQLEEGTFYDY